MNLDALEKRIRECKACSLGEASARVLGTGSENPKLMIVGEAPGKHEIQTGRPFSGPTGVVIAQILKELSLTKEQVWLTNVVKCPTPGFRDPYDNEIRKCGRFLNEEIRLLRPEKILALGKTAAYFFTGSQLPVKELRGRIRTYRSIPVVVTYHPSAVKRFPFLEAHFLEDLKLFGETEKSERIPDWSKLIHEALEKG